MKHNHDHHCQCKHLSVKYCSHCSTVYCEGCNQEWTAKVNWSYTYNNPITYPYGITYDIQGILTSGSAQNSNTLNDSRTTTCTHGVS